MRSKAGEDLGWFEGEIPDKLAKQPIEEEKDGWYAWTGAFDEAFRLLDHLLVVPNGLSVPMLKLDPTWDPLRKDPRFQALIDKYSPKT